MCHHLVVTISYNGPAELRWIIGKGYIGHGTVRKCYNLLVTYVFNESKPIYKIEKLRKWKLSTVPSLHQGSDSPLERKAFANIKIL